MASKSPISCTHSCTEYSVPTAEYEDTPVPYDLQAVLCHVAMVRRIPRSSVLRMAMEYPGAPSSEAPPLRSTPLLRSFQRFLSYPVSLSLSVCLSFAPWILFEMAVRHTPMQERSDRHCTPPSPPPPRPLSSFGTSSMKRWQNRSFFCLSLICFASVLPKPLR